MRLLLLEILFVACAVAGVALVSVAAALILGGVVGVLACERASVQVKRDRPRSA